MKKKKDFLWFLIIVCLWFPFSASANMLFPLPILAASFYYPPFFLFAICFLEFLVFFLARKLSGLLDVGKWNLYLIVFSANIVTSFFGTLFGMLLMAFPVFEEYFYFPFGLFNNGRSEHHFATSLSSDTLVGVFIFFVLTSIVEWLLYELFCFTSRSTTVFSGFSSVQLFLLTMLANSLSYAVLLFVGLHF